MLRPNTEYYRADGTTLIGKTTSQSVFSFPLAASAQLSGTYAWTGLNGDWTSATDTCALWTSASSSTVKGRVGNTTVTTGAAISTAEQICNNAASLNCVEQP